MAIRVEFLLSPCQMALFMEIDLFHNFNREAARDDKGKCKIKGQIQYEDSSTNQENQLEGCTQGALAIIMVVGTWAILDHRNLGCRNLSAGVVRTTGPYQVVNLT